MTPDLRRVAHINQTAFQIIFGGENSARIGPANDNRKPFHKVLSGFLARGLVCANLVFQPRRNKAFIQQNMGAVGKPHRCQHMIANPVGGRDVAGAFSIWVNQNTELPLRAASITAG